MLFSYVGGSYPSVNSLCLPTVVLANLRIEGLLVRRNREEVVLVVVNTVVAAGAVDVTFRVDVGVAGTCSDSSIYVEQFVRIGRCTNPCTLLLVRILLGVKEVEAMPALESIVTVVDIVHQLNTTFTTDFVDEVAYVHVLARVANYGEAPDVACTSAQFVEGQTLNGTVELTQLSLGLSIVEVDNGEPEDRRVGIALVPWYRTSAHRNRWKRSIQMRSCQPR